MLDIHKTIGALLALTAVFSVALPASLAQELYNEHEATWRGEVINAEVFATEIIRTIVGSIGLIMMEKV